jgi:hypothetical protein
LGSHVARSIGARDVTRHRAKLFAAHSKPKFIRADNGREFIADLVQEWLAAPPRWPGLASAMTDQLEVAESTCHHRDWISSAPPEPALPRAGPTTNLSLEMDRVQGAAQHRVHAARGACEGPLFGDSDEVLRLSEFHASLLSIRSIENSRLT